MNDLLSFDESDFIGETSHFRLQVSFGAFQGLDLFVQQTRIVGFSRRTLLRLRTFFRQRFFTCSQHLTQQFDLLMIGRMLLTKFVILSFQSSTSRRQDQESIKCL